MKSSFRAPLDLRHLILVIRAALRGGGILGYRDDSNRGHFYLFLIPSIELTTCPIIGSTMSFEMLTWQTISANALLEGGGIPGVISLAIRSSC